MNKNFFKPKFKIQRVYNKEHEATLYSVSVMYWWFPVWFVALRQIFDNGLINTGAAVFNSEEDAIEYIKRRYNVITPEKYEERGEN